MTLPASQRKILQAARPGCRGPEDALPTGRRRACGPWHTFPCGPDQGNRPDRLVHRRPLRAAAGMAVARRPVPAGGRRPPPLPRIRQRCQEPRRQGRRSRTPGGFLRLQLPAPPPSQQRRPTDSATTSRTSCTGTCTSRESPSARPSKPSRIRRTDTQASQLRFVYRPAHQLLDAVIPSVLYRRFGRSPVGLLVVILCAPPCARCRSRDERQSHTMGRDLHSLSGW